MYTHFWIFLCPVSYFEIVLKILFFQKKPNHFNLVQIDWPNNFLKLSLIVILPTGGAGSQKRDKEINFKLTIACSLEEHRCDEKPLFSGVNCQFGLKTSWFLKKFSL